MALFTTCKLCMASVLSREVVSCANLSTSPSYVPSLLLKCSGAFVAAPVESFGGRRSCRLENGARSYYRPNLESMFGEWRCIVLLCFSVVFVYVILDSSNGLVAHSLLVALASGLIFQLLRGLCRVSCIFVIFVTTATQNVDLWILSGRRETTVTLLIPVSTKYPPQRSTE